MNTQTHTQHTRPILVTSCPNLDNDSLISSHAYCEFLQSKGFHTIHKQHINLNELQKEIFELCQIQIPQSLNPLEHLNEIDIILINPYSIDTLHPNISPQNVIGAMGKKKPQYIEELHNKQLHFEYVQSFSTLITEKFIFTNTPISTSTASLLLIGILFSTQGLNEDYATNRDFVAVEFLQKSSNLTQERIIKLMNKL